MNFLKKLFGKKKVQEAVAEDKFTEDQYDQDYEQKVQGLENILGKMNNIVGHSIIPFAVGGAVDMYYFPNHIEGTGFATMELLDPDGNGPMPNLFGTYELTAFTKQPYSGNAETETAFDSIKRRVCGIFTTIGNYSFDAVLNPYQTCEIPRGDEDTIYLIFDKYQPGTNEFNIGGRIHHLLLCIEVFKNEMDYARANGGKNLIEKLKEARFYPYSDLDREPVV